VLAKPLLRSVPELSLDPQNPLSLIEPELVDCVVAICAVNVKRFKQTFFVLVEEFNAPKFILDCGLEPDDPDDSTVLDLVKVSVKTL
jgi:hypothetical protein